MKNESQKNNSLYLMIGNSRLHWALFEGENLTKVWHTKHLIKSIKSAEVFPNSLGNYLVDHLPLYIASVVPSQTVLWQKYPQAKSLGKIFDKVSLISRVLIRCFVSQAFVRFSSSKNAQCQRELPIIK